MQSSTYTTTQRWTPLLVPGLASVLIRTLAMSRPQGLSETETPTEAQSKPTAGWRSSKNLRIVLALLVLLVSALEGWYGQPELFGDDISYLDVVNMIRIGDWKAALNPLWSIGYPLLLSVARLFVPNTVAGELRAVFFLNIAISLGAYFAFIRLMEEILRFHRRSSNTVALSPLTLVGATFAYLTAAVGCARVSSIGPDLLVAGLFFASLALMLRLLTRPAVEQAVTLGVVLGLGNIVKAFFLPLAAIFITILFVNWLRDHRIPIFTVAVCWLLFVLAYASCLSWAFGKATLGESAALNYEFHVNQLPHWMGWQGDGLGSAPAGSHPHGTPIHPIQLIGTNPPVFAFGEPFHVTYPPQFNMPYWYQGYRHFTRLGNVARAIAVNLHSTAGVIVRNAGMVLAVLLCALAGYKYRSDSIPWRRALFAAGPWILPPVLGILLYEQVHFEARYIAGFVAVLAMLPIVLLELGCATLKPTVYRALLFAIVLGGSADLLVQLHGPMSDLIHRKPVQTEGQWAVAGFLTQAGLRPGDRVASVDYRNELRCAWAYGARVRIVAAIGNDAYDPSWQDQLKDLHTFFDDPGAQRHALDLFRNQGAVAVIAPDLPFNPTSPGWQHVAGTSAWVLLLR